MSSSQVPGTASTPLPEISKRESRGARDLLGEDDDGGLVDAAVGQIIQGEDGEYYVLVNDDGTGTDDLDSVSNIQVVVNEDGTETLVLENNQTHDGDGQFLMPGGEHAHGLHGNRVPRRRTVLAETEDGRYEVVEVLDDDEEDDTAMAVGAMATAETGEEGLDGMRLDPMPQGMKMRRNRVYGTCRCPECGQSFVNTARLERHLAVHQVFGSFLCPLCGKTYKYEYNLFYHWRRTCRDLNELLQIEERKIMDVNNLRQLVDDVAQKKAEVTPMEIGISARILYGHSPFAKLEMPSAGPARRGQACRACGVVVLAPHMERHIAIHKGLASVDERSVSGGFFCDLCGLMFRQHFNLIKHWRTSCPEIQANLPEDIELTMDDDGLRRMVSDLLKRSVTGELDDESTLIASADADAIASKHVNRLAQKTASQLSSSDPIVEQMRSRRHANMDEIDVDVDDSGRGGIARRRSEGVGESGEAVDQLEAEEMEAERRRVDAEADETFDERWADEQGIVFADDFMDDDEQLLLGEDGQLGPLGLSSAANRAKWSMAGGPVQCPECFRSFANAGRLERHLAGFHASYGTHHCILCGNRFKYDYNLLYHYRRSCPYTKAFIDRDVREQMDAASLRKLVRNLAQKEVRLTPQMRPHMRLMNRSDLGAIIAGEKQQNTPLRYTTTQPPAHLLMPRPGLRDGKTCPVCGIIFYGNGAVDRHMKAAHPNEWEEYEAGGGMHQEEGATAAEFLHQPMAPRHRMPPGGSAHHGRNAAVETETIEPDETENGPVEEPPTLVPEAPGEQPVLASSHRQSLPHRATTMEIETVEDVQGLIDSGQLDVQDGDQIILVENDEDIERLVQGQAFNSSDLDVHISQTTVTTTSITTQANEGGRRRSGRGVRSQDDGNHVIATSTETHSRRGRRAVKQDDSGLEVAEILTEMKADAGGKQQKAKTHTSGSPRRAQPAHTEEDIDVEVEDDDGEGESEETSRALRSAARKEKATTGKTATAQSPTGAAKSAGVRKRGSNEIATTNTIASANRRSPRSAPGGATPWKNRKFD